MAVAHAQHGCLCPDEKFLQEIVQSIGKEWRTLGRMLGISESRIDQIKEQYSASQEECIFQVLREWRTTNGKQATFACLSDAFEKIKRNDLAADIRRGRISTRCTFQSPQDRWMVVADLRKNLEWFYENRLCKIPMPPWEEETYNIEDIFINVNMLHLSSSLDDKYLQLPLLSHYELFPRQPSSTTNPSEEHKTRYLLKGKAGSGKSTVVSKLAHDWRTKNPNSPLKDFDLLFVLRLRLLGYETNLGEAIKSQLLPEDAGYNAEDIEHIIRSKNYKVALILDGLDEFVFDKKCPRAGNVVKLIEGEQFRHTLLLITMRPWKLFEVKHLSDYFIFEVCGFSPDNVDEYILQRAFRNDKKTGQHLIEYLESNHLKEGIGAIPLLTALTCQLWKRDPDILETPPERVGELFHHLCQCLESHEEKKDGDKEDERSRDGFSEFEDEDDTPEDERGDGLPFLFKFGKLALEGLIQPQQKLMYRLNEFKGHVTEEDIQLGRKTGLLLFEEKQVWTRSGRLTVGHRWSGKKKLIKYVSFYHKLIQEKCAGMYLGELIDNGKESELTAILVGIDTVTRALDLGYILLFASYESIESARAILENLYNVYRKEIEDKMERCLEGSLSLQECYNIQRFLELCLHCHFESNSGGRLSGIMRKIFSHRAVRCIGVSCYTVRALDYFLKHCCEMTSDIGNEEKCSVDSFEMMHLSARSTTTLRELIKHFPSVEMEHIKNMKLFALEDQKSLKEIHDKCAKMLKKSLIGHHTWNYYEFVAKFHLIQMLDEWQCSQTPIHLILESLAKVRLKRISFTGISLSSLSASLAKVLHGESQEYITDLNLGLCGLEEEESEEAFSCLSKLTNLVNLNLVGNEIGPQFCKELSKLKNIETLFLEQTMKRPEIAPLFSKAVVKLSSLRVLELRRNHFSNEGILTLMDSIKSLEHITDIRIPLDQIKSESLPQLVETIGQKTLITNLRLAHSSQPQELLQAFVKVISKLENLSDLRLSGIRPTENFVSDFEPITYSLIAEFCEALSKLTFLETLSLLHITLDFESFKELVDKLQEHPNKVFKTFRFSREHIPNNDDMKALLKEVSCVRIW